jgi:DDE domain
VGGVGPTPPAARVESVLWSRGQWWGRSGARLYSLRPRPSSETAAMTTCRPRPPPSHALPSPAFATTGCNRIVLAVRWYLRFGLLDRDVEELLAERAIDADHITVDRWVPRSRRGRLTPSASASIALGPLAGGPDVGGGRQPVARCLRAIDQFGQVIDVLVASRRDMTAARRLFKRACGAGNLLHGVDLGASQWRGPPGGSTSLRVTANRPSRGGTTGLERADEPGGSYRPVQAPGRRPPRAVLRPAGVRPPRTSRRR